MLTMAFFRSDAPANDGLECWNLLALAIILKAVEDYRSLAAEDTYYMREAELWIHNRKLKEIEMFFTSEYGDLLCYGKGAHILEKLQNE